MNKKRWIVLSLLGAGSLVLVGCSAGDDTTELENQGGMIVPAGSEVVSNMDGVSDFSEPVTIEVVTPEGEKYVYTISESPEYDLADLVGFSFPGQITEPVVKPLSDTKASVIVLVPEGMDLTDVVPTITTAEGVIVDPPRTSGQDFTDSVTYTVDPQGAALYQYEVTVIPVPADGFAAAQESMGDEPMVEDTDEPMVEDTDEPMVEDTDEPMVEDIDEPMVEDIDEPMVEDIDEPMVEDIDEPMVEDIDEPMVEDIDEPMVEDIDEPMVEDTDEPMVEDTDEPMVEDGTGEILLPPEEETEEPVDTDVTGAEMDRPTEEEVEPVTPEFITPVHPIGDATDVIADREADKQSIGDIFEVTEGFEDHNNIEILFEEGVEGDEVVPATPIEPATPVVEEPVVVVPVEDTAEPVVEEPAVEEPVEEMPVEEVVEPVVEEPVDTDMTGSEFDRPTEEEVVEPVTPEFITPVHPIGDATDVIADREADKQSIGMIYEETEGFEESNNIEVLFEDGAEGDEVVPATPIEPATPVVEEPVVVVPVTPLEPATPVEEVVEPVVEEVIEPVVEEVIEPVVEEVIEPVVEEVIEPVVEEVIEPVVEDVIEPVDTDVTGSEFERPTEEVVEPVTPEFITPVHPIGDATDVIADREADKQSVGIIYEVTEGYDEYDNIEILFEAALEPKEDDSLEPEMTGIQLGDAEDPSTLEVLPPPSELTRPFDRPEVAETEDESPVVDATEVEAATDTVVPTNNTNQKPGQDAQGVVNWIVPTGSDTPSADTDKDGVSDLAERLFGRDPLNYDNYLGGKIQFFNDNGFIDSDNDGLDDDLEDALGTDFRRVDTDGDGYGDLNELMNNTDPRDPRDP